MAHHDFELLPRDIAYGSVSGPMAHADVVTTTSGYRHTNNLQDQYLRKLTLSFNARTPINAGVILAVFEAVGIVDTFLQRDHGDWNTTDGDMRLRDAAGEGAITKDDQPMQNTVDLTEVGDGSTTTFTLGKKRTKNTATHFRLITKPQLTSPVPLVALDGVLKATPADYSIAAATGICTFVVAPGVGVVPTWGGSFFIPVAFVDSRFNQHILTGDLHQALNLELTEVRL